SSPARHAARDTPSWSGAIPEPPSLPPGPPLGDREVLAALGATGNWHVRGDRKLLRGYTDAMRMKFAFGVGFGLGYYLGAMAGRERYEQINRLAGQLRSSEAFQTAEEKAKAAVDSGVSRAQ